MVFRGLHENEASQFDFVLSVFEISWKCCFSNYQGSVWGIVTPKVTLELISISSFESVSKYVFVVVK